MYKIIHNVETGEIIKIDLTSDEIAEFEAAVLLTQTEQQKIDEENANKKAERQVLLEKLGITEEEAKLLLS